MRKYKSLFLLFISSIIFFSCEKEILDNNSDINTTKNVSIKDGRLSFESKEEFTRIYQKLVNANENELFSFFQPLYEKGFYSLRPIVIEENEKFLYEHYKKIVKLEDSFRATNRSEEDIFDNLDDIEDIIGDDVFAAFLNNDAEILVADEIYKYTDVGLFISKELSYDNLQNFLDLKNISKNLAIETTETFKQAILNEYPNNGLTLIDENISYFKLLYIDPDGNSGGGGGGNGYYNPTPGSPVSSDPSYLAFLNNLSNCTPHSGFFGNLFGDNNVCIDKYESRRRVKTKAFNYNYFLVYHLGVKCVHQYKGWTGLWRTEATDEIRLVVEAAQFQYDLNAITGNTAINNLIKERAYFLNNQKILYTGPNNMTLGQWNAPAVTYTNLNSLPPIFKDDLSFEFFSTGWDWLDSQIQNGINSNTSASKLNEWFYNGLYSEITNQIRTAINNSNYNPASNRTFVAKFPEQGKLIFQKSVLDQGFGIGIREKTFDWGAEFRFSANTTDNDGWRFSGGQGNIMVRPSNFRVKIIGAARRGGSWHGSKFNVGID